MPSNKPAKTNKPIRYSLKQRETVRNYFNAQDKETFGNLYQSAVKAGFSKSYAKSIVRDTPWINELKQELAKYDPEHIYRGFQDIATNGKQDRDRLKALEMMGKAQGMFVDRVQQDVRVEFINDMPRPETEYVEAERIDEDS